MSKYLDYTGLTHYDGLIKDYINTHGENSIFWCTYNTTTSAQITEAVNNGKLPVIMYNEKLCLYNGTYEGGHQFINVAMGSGLHPTKTYFVFCSLASNWSASDTQSTLQDKLVAGNNITITNTKPYTISATTPSNMVTTDTTQILTGRKTFYDLRVTTGSPIKDDGNLTLLMSTGNGVQLGEENSEYINLKSNHIPRYSSDGGSTYKNIAFQEDIINVEANPLTTTETLTGITIGNTSYAVQGGGSSEIFYVVYETTTYAEITAAIEANKLPVLKYGNNIYQYVGKTAGLYMFYNTTTYPQVKGYAVNSSDTWQEVSVYLQKQLTAGENITIDDNNVISATGGGSSYTFTNGLTESSGTVSWDLNDRIVKTNDNSFIIFPGQYNMASNKSATNGSINMAKLSNNYSTNVVNASGLGSVILGNARGISSSTKMATYGSGSLAGGDCYDGLIEATNDGCFAFGSSNSTYGNHIATVYGSAVIGQGLQTGSNSTSQTKFVCGKCNSIDTTSTQLFLVGNGTSNSARSNAMALDWSGNGRFKGDLYTGCAADSTGGTKVIPQTLNAAETTPTIEGSICWTYE